MECTECGSREHTVYRMYGFDALYCQHCNNVQLRGAPEAYHAVAFTELNGKGIAAQHGNLVTEYRDCLFYDAFEGEVHPTVVLEAIREYTYMIAADGPEPDMLEGLQQLVDSLSIQKDSKGE